MHHFNMDELIPDIITEDMLKDIPPNVPIMNEIKDEPIVGRYVGQCKWFNDRYGYGFITVTQGDYKGRDIFVHHSGIKPLNSIYKTLKKGEYINFNIISGGHGPQAVDITGIGGGSLMCDVLPAPRFMQSQQQVPQYQVTRSPPGFTNYKRPFAFPRVYKQPM
jgi:cold shock protein